MTTTIKPTVGRVVWFYPSAAPLPEGFAVPELGQPLAAIVARVWHERSVNLAVFDANGVSHAFQSVPLIQEGEEAPDGHHAAWMPYQISQAKKAEDSANDAQKSAVAATRVDFLDMALRTPGLNGCDDVLKAAAAYQAHIDGTNA